MVEMIRLRIFSEDGRYYIRRQVRRDWFPVLDNEGREVSSDTYEEAVELLNKYINK